MPARSLRPSIRLARAAAYEESASLDAQGVPGVVLIEEPAKGVVRIEADGRPFGWTFAVTDERLGADHA